MLLALVEQEGLQDVGRYGVAGQVQVLFVRFDRISGLFSYSLRRYNAQVAFILLCFEVLMIDS